MDEQEQGSIGGGWLGTYVYKGALQGKPPVRFEGTFSEPDRDGKFSGTILDDGDLGEANVTGNQSGHGVRFSKAYQRRGRDIVSYEGTLADDGRTMQGTWRIADNAHGVWDARRLWSESETGESVADAQEQKVVREREVVRLG